MSLAGPQPVTTNPLARLAGDLRSERAATVPFPPGDTNFSARRTRRALVDPLNLLLEAYERHGPVFTLRIFHGRSVFMIGPEANHHMLVSHAQDFAWRDGHMGELIPLLGDGLLTIDGDFHRRSRKIMLPAFHHERIAGAARRDDRRDRGGDRPPCARGPRSISTAGRGSWRCGSRCARCSGSTPTGPPGAPTPPPSSSARWASGASPTTARCCAGPARRGRACSARAASSTGSSTPRSSDRRASGERGEDMLSLLIDAVDEEGRTLSQRHIRDEVMTLLFAGHDTTTSTVAFLFHELARAPEWADRAAGERRGPRALPRRGAAAVPAGVDRAAARARRLRVRRPDRPGRRVRHYSSWVTHRLPGVWAEPDAFRPERFAPGAREQIPKGAYVPFGGGSRTCIGMRFGQQEIRVIARAILRDVRLDLPPGHRLKVRQTPTIGPIGGLPVRVRAAR